MGVGRVASPGSGEETAAASHPALLCWNKPFQQALLSCASAPLEYAHAKAIENNSAFDALNAPRGCAIVPSMDGKVMK
jgi:hypothetical protein